MPNSLPPTSSTPRGRFPWIDYARGIAILLVIYRHVYEGISRAGLGGGQYSYLEHANIIFYSFRMPLFFILSGVFIGKSLAKRGMGQLLHNKFSTLLYPYFLWATLQVTLQLILNKYVNADRTLADYGNILVFPRRIDQFWYLYALFNVSVFYMFTRQVLKLRLWQQLAGGILMYLLSSYASTHHVDLGLLHDILHYYFFFALGDLISNKMLDKSMHTHYASWKFFLLLLPMFAAGQYYFLHTNLQNGNNMYVEAYQPVLFAFIALSGCAFMVSISFILERYNVLKILRVVGYHSLYIYLTHVLVASACRMLLVKALGITQLPLLLAICLPVATVVPILLYKAAMHYGLWWLYSLDKPIPPAEVPRAAALN